MSMVVMQIYQLLRQKVYIFFSVLMRYAAVFTLKAN